MQKIMFSVNSYDSDGDIFETGVYLHYETNGIRRKIDNIVNEITENYGDYSKKARGAK